MDIHVLKDAASAIDKLIGAIGKLGSLLKSATINGVELFDAVAARRAWGALTSFTKRQVGQFQSQRRLFMPKLQDFVEKPTSDKWEAIRHDIEAMLSNIEDMTKDLEKSSPVIVTTDFYPILVGTLIERKDVLTKLLNLSEPKTPEEFEAIKSFLARYDVLIEELIKAGDAMNTYVKSMMEKGKLPKDTLTVRFGPARR